MQGRKKSVFSADDDVGLNFLSCRDGIFGTTNFSAQSAMTVTPGRCYYKISNSSGSNNDIATTAPNAGTELREMLMAADGEGVKNKTKQPKVTHTEESIQLLTTTYPFN